MCEAIYPFNNVVESIKKLVEIVDHNVKPQFLFFFWGGVIIKWYQFDDIKINRKMRILIIMLLLILLLAVCIGFYYQGALWSILVRYSLASIVAVCLLGAKNNCNFNILHGHIRMYVFLGNNSFFVYLWHVMGRSIALILTKNQYNIIYYAICIIWVILLCILIRKFKEKRLFNILLGGC